MTTILDTVLVGGEFRVVGVVSAEDLEEMERAYDAGDARMEARLKLLREGRPETRPRLFFDGQPPPPPPAGSWSNKIGVEVDPSLPPNRWYLRP